VKKPLGKPGGFFVAPSGQGPTGIPFGHNGGSQVRCSMVGQPSGAQRLLARAVQQKAAGEIQRLFVYSRGQRIL